MKGTANSDNCSGLTHSQASNSGCAVARLTSTSVDQYTQAGVGRYRSCRRHSAMTRTRTRLLTIGRPHPAASIVDLCARHPFELPIGSDYEDLVCGACGTVVLTGWSRSSAAERLVVDSQMLIKCGKCRTYNVVPTARLAEKPREALAVVHKRLRGLYILHLNVGTLK